MGLTASKLPVTELKLNSAPNNAQVQFEEPTLFTALLKVCEQLDEEEAAYSPLKINMQYYQTMLKKCVDPDHSIQAMTIKDFCEAAESGEVSEAFLQSILTQDAAFMNAGKSDRRYNDTAFWLALKNTRIMVVRLLLADPRVDVNQQDGNGYSALLWAIKRGNTDVVKLLLTEPRLRAAGKYERGKTELIVAAEDGHVEIVRSLLLDPRFDCNVIDHEGGTALMRAVINGHEDIVTLMLNSPRVNINQKNECGFDAFLVAVDRQKLGSVKILLASPNIDVNQREDDDGWSALFFAIKEQNAEMVKLLLKDPRMLVNQSENEGLSPLLFAVDTLRVEMVKLVLAESRVDVNFELKRGRLTALSLAALNGFKEVIEVLLKDGRVDVYHPASASINKTALKIAVVKKHFECVPPIAIEMICREIVKHSLKIGEPVEIDEGSKNAILDGVFFGVTIDEILPATREKYWQAAVERWKVKNAADLFAMFVFNSDGLVQLKGVKPDDISSVVNSTDEDLSATVLGMKSVLYITQKLPMELQMVMSLRAFGSTRTNIPTEYGNPALETLTKKLTLQT